MQYYDFTPIFSWGNMAQGHEMDNNIKLNFVIVVVAAVVTAAVAVVIAVVAPVVVVAVAVAGVAVAVEPVFNFHG